MTQQIEVVVLVVVGDAMKFVEAETGVHAEILDIRVVYMGLSKVNNRPVSTESVFCSGYNTEVLFCFDWRVLADHFFYFNYNHSA